MAKQTINIGASPNDGTGTPLRTAFDYTNQNFTELYTATGPSGNNIVVPGNATITGDLTVRTNKLKVTSIGVGAGTTTPAAILHSTQTSSYDALILDSDSAGTYCIQNWRVGGVQKAQAFLDVADDSLLIRTNTATGPLKFGCNNIIQHRIDPLGVFTWLDGAGGTRMTLNSTGLGVGTSPSALLHVQKSQNSETTAIINNTNTGTGAAVRLDLQSNASNYLTLQSYGQNYSGNAFGIAAAKLNVVSENAATAFSSGLAIGTVSTNPLYFATANAVRMTLDASGNLSLPNGNLILGTSGKGIDFSATTSGSGTMTSELLNDYEEGTFTATLKGSTTDPTTPVTSTARYTKIGRVVNVVIYFGNVNTTGASGAVQVIGLPFTSGSGPFYPGSAVSGDTATFTGTLGAWIAPASTQVDVLASVSGGSVTGATHNAGAGRYLALNVTYTV